MKIAKKKFAHIKKTPEFWNILKRQNLEFIATRDNTDAGFFYAPYVPIHKIDVLIKIDENSKTKT